MSNLLPAARKIQQWIKAHPRKATIVYSVLKEFDDAIEKEGMAKNQEQGVKVDALVSPDLLRELRKTYEPHKIPTCHLCEKTMILHSTGPGGYTYYCADQNHFSESRVVITRVGDWRVIALIDAYEKLIAG